MKRTQDIESQEDFFEIFNQKDKPVLIDFHAEWCSPCKSIAPVFEELANEFAEDIIILKVDIEKNQELAGIFMVRSLPSVVSSSNGEVVKATVGAQRKDFYKDMVIEAIESHKK